MKRRIFLEKSPVLFLISQTINPSLTFGTEADSKITAIASKSPEELIAFHRKELLEDMVPSWYEVAIDDKFGGIMVNLTRDRKLKNTDKGGYYIGRHLYIMSRLYNNHKKDQRFLGSAKKTWEFMKKFSWDKNGEYYTNMTREGKPLPGEKRIFCDIYGAYGAIEYFNASGDSEAVEHARKTIMKITDRILSPSFIHKYTETAFYPPGTSWFGVWLHFLRVMTNYLKVKSDPDIESIAVMAVDRLMIEHVDRGKNFVYEVIDGHTMKPFNEVENRWVWDCHVIQAMWMVMDEYLRNGKTEKIPLTYDIIRWMIEACWDEQYGGMPDIVYQGRPDWTKWNKTLWGQVETMNALLHIIEISGNQWALDWYSKVFDYYYNKFPDRQYGGMFTSLDREGKAAPETINMEFFHRPRYIMNTIESLERIKNR